MTFSGHVRNGIIVLDNGATLPEGAAVRIEVEMGAKGESPEKPVPSLYERYQPFIGILNDLPSDMAEQHDHYIHGTPKK
jgi:hypothetical protein